jgi:hypothetical protein
MIEGFLGKLAEHKMQEANARGELKNLPGAGKPVRIENFYFLPPAFKFAYTVLKNSGYLNLDEEETVPVASLKDNINLRNDKLSNSTKNQEKSTASVVSDEKTSSDMMPSKSTSHNLEKATKHLAYRK